MTREEEQRIIQRVISGETPAFDLLVIDNQDKVYSLALRMTGNEEDALDMAQEAFLRAFNNLGVFRGESRFSVWLFRLTTNICIDFLRKQRRYGQSSLTYINEEDEAVELELPELRYSPESELEKRELREAVDKAMSELPPDYRQILLLREMAGLSYGEISRELSLEEGTVKSRLFRARRSLAAILTRDGNLFGGGTS